MIVSVGIYREHLRLKAGVALRSKGADTKGMLGLKRAEETVIKGLSTAEGERSSTGVSMAEGATLDGFTITGVGTYDHERWKFHHATHGENQDHDHIGEYAAPAVGADGVNCTIVNNIVHHNGHTGIASRGAEGTIVTPLVKSNICYRNMGGGIGFMGGSSGVIAGNTCYENFFAGIGHSRASPLVENNECHGNVRAGIGISNGAHPVVRRNKCYRNRRAGIGIRTGKDTAPVVTDNDCYENGMAGIGCEDGAAPLIQGNRCLRNQLAGIGARGNARPLIMDNECRDNKASGIGFDHCDNGRAVVRNNLVIDNAMVAIGIHSGWKVELLDNQLSRQGGLPPIVMVFDGAECGLRGNTISGDGVAGVRVGGTAHLSNNNINGGTVRKSGPPHFGVWALAGSRVILSNNEFTSWRHALHASEATVTAFDNTAEDFAGTGFLVIDPAEPAQVFDNVARSNDPKAVAVRVEGDDGAVRNNKVLPMKK